MTNYTKLKKQIENLQKILWHDAMQVDLTLDAVKDIIYTVYLPPMDTRGASVIKKGNIFYVSGIKYNNSIWISAEITSGWVTVDIDLTNGGVQDVD